MFMLDKEALKAKSHDTAERVWRFTAEPLEHQDLYPGAELELIRDSAQTRFFVVKSGRELPNVQLDKTIPRGNFNHCQILEVREAQRCGLH